MCGFVWGTDAQGVGDVRFVSPAYHVSFPDDHVSFPKLSTFLSRSLPRSVPPAYQVSFLQLTTLRAGGCGTACGRKTLKGSPSCLLRRSAASSSSFVLASSAFSLPTPEQWGQSALLLDARQVSSQNIYQLTGFSKVMSPTNPSTRFHNKE